MGFVWYVMDGNSLEKFLLEALGRRIGTLLKENPFVLESWFEERIRKQLRDPSSLAAYLLMKEKDPIKVGDKYLGVRVRKSEMAGNIFRVGVPGSKAWIVRIAERYGTKAETVQRAIDMFGKG